MILSEKDLENLIFNASNDDLSSRGLPVDGIAKRQLRIGNYGIADLVYFKPYVRRNGIIDDDSMMDITVVELKKDKVGVDAFLQALRYCSGISSYLQKRSPELYCTYKIKLIGSRVDLNDDVVFITNLINPIKSTNSRHNLSSVDFYSYEYSWDGIKFEGGKGLLLRNEGFNFKNKK